MPCLIADELGCDSCRIEAADPYPVEYDPTVARTSREPDDDARDEIDGELPDLTGCDTLVLGSPIWGLQAPLIMQTTSGSPRSGSEFDQISSFGNLPAEGLQRDVLGFRSTADSRVEGVDC